MSPRQAPRASGKAESTRSVIPRQSIVFTLGFALFTAACSAPPGQATSRESSTPSQVRLGIQVLLEDSVHLVRGRRVGLMTNHTGVFSLGVGMEGGAPRESGSVIDALHEAPDIELVALFGPEHSIRGDEQPGVRIESEVDANTGVPIHSLYGRVTKPTPEMLSDVDVLVFDMQDVGARYYTYVSTMARAMEAAGENNIPFIVLDRPNPIRGDVVQGTVLDPAFSTFVGLYPVPMRHGMTVGELARMYVGEFGIDVELHVVPLDGWTRDMMFDETNLEWIAPSPNMPSIESALAYPGTCLFEGTPLSVGRGTDRPFQWVGAPWLDGEALAVALNLYNIEGVRFEATSFTPATPGDAKFDGVAVEGVRLVAESTTYDAPRASVAMLIETYRASAENWTWNVAHFDRLAGNDALRMGIEAGDGLEALTASWDTALSDFERLRTPYLIYE